LARVSATAIEKALHKARDAGVIKIDDQQIASTKAAFSDFARSARRSGKAPGAPSTYDDLLNRSALKDSETEKRVFEDVYFSRRTGTGALWKQLRDRGIANDKINRLRLQGKLAYLTHNYAPLTELPETEQGSPEKL